MNAHAVRDATGDILYYEATIENIDENKREKNILEIERDTLFAILENDPSGILVMDRHGVFHYVNPEFTKISGYTLSEVPTEKDWLQKAFPDSDYRKKVTEDWKNDYRRQLKGDNRQHTIICKDGSKKSIEIRVTHLKEFIITAMNDITARRLAEDLLKESEERYRSIFEGSKDAIYITTKNGKFVDFNQAFLELFGYTKEDMFNIYSKESYADPADRERFMEEVEKKGSVKDYGIRLRKKDGRHMDCLLTVTARRAEDGSISELQGTIRDVTEKIQMEERLRELSNIDDLTGVYNRRGFFALALQQMRVADRTRKEMLLFFVDLDKMKQINDTLGHKEGDNALLDVASILKQTFRESDIIGRIGGDEFAIIATDTTDKAREVLTERLQTILKLHNRPEKKYQLSLSVGSARYDPDYPLSLDRLLAQADILMYEEKKNKSQKLLNNTYCDLNL